MYVPLERVLLRAPLLPAASLRGAARALDAHPLGALAIEVASPTLARAKRGPARDRALERYARRAAFRPTPSGLLAGVCLGALGVRTEIATGSPVAHLTPSWSRTEAAARAWLEDPAVRELVRLRVGASARRGPGELRWLGPGDPYGETRVTGLDERTGAIWDATAKAFAPWPEVRARARLSGESNEELDELLLILVDDGLLEVDLGPPLIGPPAAEHLRDRLASMGRLDEADEVEHARSTLAAGDLAGGRAALAALPGRSERDVHAVLVHGPPTPPLLERAAVERAASLIPLLTRLQEALTPPAAERFASAAIADALDAATEIFGAGAFDLGALDAGEYGVDLADEPGAGAGFGGPPPALIALLVDGCVDAARRGAPALALDPKTLAAALAEVPAAAPATAELFLTPMPRRRGARPGDGWLLGLHAPAGASLGRFLHALGAPGVEAGAEIDAAERRARPLERRLDVGFAPAPDLADLCAHPPIRRQALAISRSSAGGSDIRPGDLELCADPGSPGSLALRLGDGGAAVVPSPLGRARSATAPPGAARLLVGWSLQRQHAPWAFSPGPLADLGFIPRLLLDGFVIAPASWRLPDPVVDGTAGRAALDRWRRATGVPRLVQAGEGDELYPVDLGSPSALADLRDRTRVFEIWPPLEATVDRDGRRVEAVVSVVEEASGAGPDLASLGRVPPPRLAPPLAGWTTYKLFGAAARQDELLISTVVPAIRAGQQAREIDAWFFLRYLDGPGRRPHLRLRVHAAAFPTAFDRRLRNALGAARTDGALATLETTEYQPERGRFGADELGALHAIFEADSDAAAAGCALEEPDPVLRLVAAFEALASGLKLDLPARHALARARRQAAEGGAGLDLELRREADAAFREHGRSLRGWLQDPEAADAATGGAARLRARVAESAGALTKDASARLLPTLLHLAAVRRLGADPEGERLGYTFWERTLDGLRAKT